MTLKPHDIIGVLVEPIRAMRPVPGDPQSCEYATDGYAAVMVSLRPGVGSSTVETWVSGKMALSVVPLPTVGDQAFWQPNLNEVIARKGNLLCDIQLRAGISDLAVTGQSLALATGELCNRIFAAH